MAAVAEQPAAIAADKQASIPFPTGAPPLNNNARGPAMPPGPEPNTGLPLSLYVGDLHPDATEAVLFEHFNPAGPVVSIRVCRDSVTRRSLGYAYVNFQTHNDARAAIEKLNFTMIEGRPCRIMWPQRDSAFRRNGGNVFIKNLHEDIDHKQLHDTFSQFGTVFSCKVALDDQGKSKSYGFVHYEKKTDAEAAIKKVNGKLILGKVVTIEKFVSRQDRRPQFTNVFVKNLPADFTKEKMEEMFEPFGETTSIYLAKTEDDKCKGFGFCNFADPASATKAIEDMNGKELSEGVSLYVSRAQKKHDRQKNLARQHEQRQRKLDQKSRGSNLYVKHLPIDMTETELKDIFAPYGEITSARIMRNEDGSSRGFAFVCYSNPEEANKALAELHNKLINDKPLYVAHAMRKQERQQQIGMQLAMGGQMGGPHPMQMHGFPGSQGFSGPQGFSGSQGMPPMSQQQLMQMWQMMQQMYYPNLQMSMMQPGQQNAGPVGHRRGRGGNNNRQSRRPHHHHPQQARVPAVIRSFESPEFTEAPKEQQRSMLAHALYNKMNAILKNDRLSHAMVEEFQGQDNSEFLHMIEDDNELKSRIAEKRDFAAAKLEKQMIGEAIHKHATTFDQHLASKLTGMLMQQPLDVVKELTNNMAELERQLVAAKEVLLNAAKPAV